MIIERELKHEHTGQATDTFVTRGYTAVLKNHLIDLMAYARIHQPTLGANTYEHTIQPIIWLLYKKYSQPQKKYVSHLTCCNKNDAQPTWVPMKIQFDISTQSFSTTVITNLLYYAIGEPLTYNGNDWMPFDGNTGGAVLWRITNANVPTGCPQIQTFKIDITTPDISAFTEFYGRILSFQQSQQTMGVTLVVTPVSEKSELGNIGSSQNRILWLPLESNWNCQGGQTFTIGEVNPGTTRTARLSDAAFTNDDYYFNDITQFINKQSIRSYGLSCASLDETTNPCRIKGISMFTPNVDTVSAVIYIADTTSKFVPNAADFSEGLMQYPTAAQGQVIQTNSGQRSIIIATNRKHSDAQDQNSARLLDNGNEVKYSYRAFHIYFSGYWDISNLSQFLTEEILSNGFTELPFIFAIPIDSQVKFTSPQFHYGLSHGHADKQAIQWVAGSSTQNITKGLSINFGPSSSDKWFVGTHGLIETYNVQTPIYRFSFQMDSKIILGWYDHSVEKWLFDVPLDQVALTNNRLTRLTLKGQDMLGSTWNDLAVFGVSAGVPWQMPMIHYFFGLSHVYLLNYMLLQPKQPWRQWWRISSVLEFSQSFYAFRKCTVQDAFQVVSSTFFLQCDLLNLPCRINQNDITINSLWTNTVQQVQVELVQNNAIGYDGLTFTSSYFELINTVALQTRVNESFQLYIFHKDCGNVEDQTYLTETQFFKSRTQNEFELGLQIIDLDLTITDCQNEIFKSLGDKAYFVQKNTGLVVLDQIPSLFDSPPINSLCSVKEWYLSNVGQTSKLSLADEASVRLGQAGRTEPLLPLQVDTTVASNIYIDFEVSIHVFLGATEANLNAAVLHPNPVERVSVKVGCFLLTELNLFLQTPTLTSSPSVQLVRFEQGKFKLRLPKPSQAISGTIDLNELVYFTSNYPGCGIDSLAEFQDPGLTTLASPGQSGYLSINPVGLDYTSGQIDLTYRYSYHNSSSHWTTYMQASTDGTLGQQNKVFRGFSLNFFFCNEEVTSNLGKQTLALFQGSTPYNVSLEEVFSFQFVDPDCAGYHYAFSSSSVSLQEVKIAQATLENNKFLIIQTQNLISKSFYLVSKLNQSGSIASVEYQVSVVNTKPQFQGTPKLSHQIEVDLDLQGDLIQTTQKWSYTSPALIDAEGHTLKMTFTGFQGLEFLEINFNEQAGQFELVVDRSKVSKSGDYQGQVTYGDNYSPEGDSLTLLVQISYTRVGEECLNATVGVSVKTDIIYDYTQSSNFNIPLLNYLKYFENSNNDQCPFYKFLVSWNQDNGSTSLDSLVQISTSGVIKLDFEALYGQLKPQTRFYIVATSKPFDKHAYLPIMLQTNLPEQVKEGQTEIKETSTMKTQSSEPIKQQQKSSVESTFIPPSKALDSSWKRESIPVAEFFSVNIQKVTRDGIVTLQFSDSMFDSTKGVILTEIDKSVLDVSLILSDQTIELGAQNIKSLQELSNITWTSQLFLKNRLVLNVKFANPLYLAQDDAKDYLQVLFLQPKFFEDASRRKSFSKTSYLLKKTMPKQITNQDSTRFFKRSKDQFEAGMNTAAIIQLSLNMVFTLALNAFLNLLQSLQIIALSLMMNLDFPANVQILIKVIFLFLNADVLDPTWTTSFLFDFSLESSYVEYAIDEAHPMFLIRQVYETGFEMYNPVFNLGGLFIIMMFTLIQVAVILPLLLYLKQTAQLQRHEGGHYVAVSHKSCRGCNKKRFKKWVMTKKEKIFFNSFILITKESYMHLVISGLLFINIPWDLKKEIMVQSSYQFNFYWLFSYICLIITLFVYPIASVWVLLSPQQKLQNPKIAYSISELYNDVNLKNWKCRLYVIIYSARRVSFILISFYLSHLQGIQVQLMLYVNLFCLIYIAQVRPLRTKMMNRHNIFYEYMIINFTSQLVLFTQFCPDPLQRYALGWIFVAELCLFLFVGFAFSTIIPSVKSMRLVFKKYFNLFQFKIKQYKREKERGKLGKELQTQEATVNILKLQEATRREKINYYEVLIQSAELSLKESQREAFSHFSKTESEIEKCRTLLARRLNKNRLGNNNPMTRDQVKELFERLTDIEKCKALLEYRVVTIIIQKWIQRENKDLLVSKFCNDYLTKILESHQKDPSQISYFQDWEKVQYCFLKDDSSLQEIAPEWFWPLDSMEQDLTAFIQSHHKVTSSEVTTLFNHMQSSSNSTIQLVWEREWIEKLSDFSPLERKRNLLALIHKFLSSGIASESQGNDFIVQRIEQLYQLLKAKSQMVLEDQQKESTDLLTFEEIVWNEVKKFN